MDKQEQAFVSALDEAITEKEQQRKQHLDHVLKLWVKQNGYEIHEGKPITCPDKYMWMRSHYRDPNETYCSELPKIDHSFLHEIIKKLDWPTKRNLLDQLLANCGGVGYLSLRCLLENHNKTNTPDIEAVADIIMELLLEPVEKIMKALYMLEHP